MSLPNTPAIRACVLAARAARHIGLKPSNMWEPGIARHLEEDIRKHGEEAAWAEWCFRLGIPELCEAGAP